MMENCMRISRLSIAVLGLIGSTGALAQRQPITVPIHVGNNHVFVRMQYQDRDLLLLLDTGAGVTLMDMAAVEAFKIKVGEPANIGGAGAGTVRGAQLSKVKLTLPEHRDINVAPAIAMPMVQLNAVEGRAVNGILGGDFFRQAVVELDYVAKEMRLHAPKTFKYSGKGSRVPLTFKDNKPHMVGEIILADGSRLRADCHVDVGSTGSLILTKPFVEKHKLLDRVGPTTYRRSGRGAGGVTAGKIGRVAGVRFGDSVLTSPITAFYGDSAGVFSRDDFDCNIGGEILRRFTVIFDYGRKEMILEPNSTLRDAFEADMSGAAFRNHTEGFMVMELMRGGPAEAAGLKEGDLIVGVDGQSARDYGLDALRLRVRREGGEVALRVRRPEGEVVIRIPLKRLV
jgi:hypothetical protein